MENNKKLGKNKINTVVFSIPRNGNAGERTRFGLSREHFMLDGKTLLTVVGVIAQQSRLPRKATEA